MSTIALDNHEFLSNLVAQNPDHPTVWGMLGEEHMASGQYADALEAFDRQIETKAEPRWYTQMGLCFAKVDQMGDSYAAFVLAGPPQTFEALSTMAEVAFKLDKFEEAAELFEKCLAQGHTTPLLRDLATCYEELGRPSDAVVCYDAALVLEPTNSNLWNNKGLAKSTMGLVDEAMECYNTALVHNICNPCALFNRGEIHISRNQLEEAEFCFRSALLLQADPDTYLNLGLVYDAMRRREQAIVAYDQALALDVDYTNVWYNKGLVFCDLGLHEQSLACFEEVLARDENDVDAWARKREALIQLHRQEEASRCQSRINELGDANLGFVRRFANRLWRLLG